MLTVLEDDGPFTPDIGPQADFFDDYHNRYCAFAGGWGAGKSYAGSRKTANLHVHNAFDDGGNATFVASLVVAPTYQLAQTVNIPQMRAAFDEMGLSHRFVADPKKYYFELPDLGTSGNPSVVYVRSADAAEMIAGFEVGAVWGDEAARWPYAKDGEDPLGDPLLQSDGRLRHPGARLKQFNLTYTNEGEDTRVFKDFEEKPKPQHALYRRSTRENAHLPSDYVDSQLAQLSADLISQYVDGYAAKLGANLLYGNFDSTPVGGKNIDGSLSLVPGLPIQMAVDFNKNPGMHAELGQWFDRDDLVTTVQEIHRKGMLIKQMVQEFDMLVGEKIRSGAHSCVELFGDSSGNTGSMSDGESYWDDIRSELDARKIPYRMRVPLSNPGVSDRINSVNSAFCSATGRVRYKIHPSCSRLIQDFKSMKWDGNEVNKKDKKLSHASDADGYRVEYLLPIHKRKATGGRVGSL